MKKTEMKIIKNIFFWANELILPIPQEILETELLNYVRTFKVTAQLAAEISSSFYEYLILANTSAINRTLKNEIEILIFQAEHMIFQTDPGNISSIFEIIENLYVKGVQKLLNYLDAYIPIDHTARSHINLSNHLKHWEIGILDSINKLQTDVYTNLQSTLYQSYEASFSYITHQITKPYVTPTEIKVKIQDELEIYDANTRNTVKLNYGSIPNILYKAFYNKLKADLYMKYDEIYIWGKIKLVNEYKGFLNDWLARKIALFDKELCGFKERKAIAGIIIKTSYFLDFCVEQLNVVLDYLDLDEITINQLFENLHDLNNPIFLEYSQAYLANSTQSSRFTLIISLCVIFTLKESTSKFYDPRNREWLLRIISAIFNNSDYQSDYTELVLISEQRLAREILKDSTNILNEHYIDLVPQVSNITMLENSDHVSKMAQIVRMSGNLLQSHASVSGLLFSLANSLENINSHNIKFNIFALECIKYEPSLHVTLVVSGWLSEDDDDMNTWSSLINREYQGQVYILKWDSSSPSKFVLELLKTLSSLLITDQIISNLLLLTTLYKLYKLDPFRQSQIRAKIAGKALAAIIKAGIFKNSSLTLIGFSLGAAVIMSCLQDLANHGEKYIHNTILMGGAASVSSQDWKNCKHAVSGRLINLYSKKDWVISVCYRITRFQKAIGSYKIDVDEIENWDVTDEIDSHQRYRQIMDKLFEKIHICG